MPGISNTALLDLINTTKEKLPDGRFSHTQDLQRYEVMDRWFADEREEIASGTEITENIALSESGQARQVRLFQRTNFNIGETQHRIKAPWTQAETHYALERREVLRNRAPARFVNLLKSRRRDAYQSLADLLERLAWSAPNGSDDDLNPYGIPYWIPKLDSTAGANGAGAGFYGGSYSGFTTTANIDPATSNDNRTDIDGGEARWRSWCAGGHDGTTEYYLTMNDAAVRTMKLTFYKINFKAPRIVEEMISGFFSRFRIYMNILTKIDYEELAKDQNVQLGNDLAPFGGRVAFMRVPVVEVPQLDSDSENPVYFVNHNQWYPYVQDGDYLREDEALRSPEYRNTFIVGVDLSYNFMCRNRRMQGVMSVAADNS